MSPTVATPAGDHPRTDEQVYRRCPPLRRDLAGVTPDHASQVTREQRRASHLAGKVIAVDPGHNGGNAAAPASSTRSSGTDESAETCDTTGTETDTGYTEALFNYNVANYLTADLEAEGATVVLTRTSNTGVGPCVTERAAIGNNAHASAAISIHADGGPPTGRGFAVLEPVADGPNDAIIAPSDTLGVDIRAAFLADTGEPVSTYDGINGIQPRDDLAGLTTYLTP